MNSEHLGMAPNLTQEQQTPFPRRVVVVGCSGAGKTTLARSLAEVLGIQHIELDALHWSEPNWKLPAVEDFQERVRHASSGDSWVTDGNYSQAREILWPRAHMVVWLDYPLPLILGRLVVRSLRRSLRGTELWNGNRERLLDQFTRESLFLHVLKTYRRRRRDYPRLFAGEYRHLQVVRFRHPTYAKRWLRSFPPLESGQSVIGAELRASRI